MGARAALLFIITAYPEKARWTRSRARCDGPRYIRFVRYFLRRGQPQVSRILLVESGSRHLIERALPSLRRTYGENIPIDLVTCYSGSPEGIETAHTVAEHRGPDGRRRLYRALAARRYPIMGIVCSAEPIMTEVEMGAGGAPAGEGFHHQRKRRLLLAGPRALARDLALRVVSRRTHGRGGRAYGGTPARISVRFAVFATLCIDRAYSARVAQRLLMKAIQVREIGGPEKLELVDLAEPAAGPGRLW